MSSLPAFDVWNFLLPSCVEAVMSTQIETSDDHMSRTERAAMRSMKPGRRREFSHGRTCARAALAALGLPINQAIPVGADREPVWPDGIVGSISHCGSVAAAAVARCADIGGLGIDLASTEPLDADILALVCRPDERSWLANADDPMRSAKLIFSAKESIFKCIWPKIRHFVDFQDIGLTVDIEEGVFAPFDWADGLPDGLIRRIEGRCVVQGEWIMTSACTSHAVARSDRVTPDN